MTRYRYRTSVLTGPWRDSAAAAFLDAIRARQVLHDESDPSKHRWVVPGRIEEEAKQQSRRGAVR